MFKPYTKEEVRKISKRLKDILSLTDEDNPKLSSWLQSDFPKEIRPITNVFDLATGKVHHLWGGTLLTATPDSRWVNVPQSNIMDFDASGSGASLRFLSEELAGD